MTATLEHIDPAALTVADNIRTAAHLDKPFVASVKARGVLVPIVAYRDPEHPDTTQVYYGQRRTLAAQQVGLDTVPVMVHDTEPTDADRLVDQWVENEHRDALTNADRARAVAQMTLAGLSVAQIARRTGTKRATITTAQAVADSRVAVEHADQMSLEDAALIAEFDGDEEAQAKLLDQARSGWPLVHTAERIREERAEQRAYEAAKAELAEAGTNVIEPPAYGDRDTLPLDQLRDSNGDELTEDTHRDCPGAVSWLRRTYRYRFTEDDEEEERVTFDTVHGCTGWGSHGHNVPRQSGIKKRADDMDDAEREAARRARRHVIESNKAWQACTTVRREWLATFATRRTAPKGAERFVAAAITRGDTPDADAYALLGLTRDQVAAELAEATPKRALHLALVLSIAAWEAATHKGTWRDTYITADTNQTVLTALGEWGYPLSEIETRVIAGSAAEPPTADESSG